MGYYVDVVVLTKSSKHGGYCVAGVGVNNGHWIRLVSSDEDSHGAIFKYNMRYENGAYCEPFDVVRVPVIGKLPAANQPENVLIDEGRPWHKLGAFSVSRLISLHPPEVSNYIFGNGRCYLNAKQIGAVDRSLTLIKVYDLIVRREDSKKPKAEFRYRGRKYMFMSVTDPDYYLAPNATWIPRALLVMSLPDSPYTTESVKEERYYKFIAKIIPL